MLTRAFEVMRYIRASAGRAGLNVVFEQTNQPRHDGNTIFLPRITLSTTKRELQQLMASTDHEVAHERFSSFGVLKEFSPTSLVMLVWNFLEDSRINVIEAKEYEGFRSNWDDCSSEVLERVLTKMAKEKSLFPQLVLALYCWESGINKELFPMLELVSHKFSPRKDLLDVLSRFSDRLVDCQQILDKKVGTTSTYNLALDILKAIEDATGEEAEKMLKEEEEKSSKKGKDSSTTTTTASASEGKEGEEQKGGEAKEASATKTKDYEDKEQEEKEYKIIKVVLTKEVFEGVSVTKPYTMGKTGVNHDPVDLDRRGREWDITDFNKFVVIDYPKKEGMPSYLARPANYERVLNEYRSRTKDLMATESSFVQQVRRLLQIRAKVQTQYGVKKGKLDASRLSRICFKAPGFSERVFKTRIENITLNVALSVLVDQSGSMGGDKYYNAMAASVLLKEVCGALNIPVEIVGFSDIAEMRGEEKPVMLIHKSFDNKVSTESLEDSFGLSSRHMFGNPDGECILWAYDRLLKRKEKKRVLLVLSDGDPCASKSGYGLEKLTKLTIEEIEAAKKVSIYGLGLCNDAVMHYYKDHSVVYKAEEIPHKLIELFERKVLS